MKNLKKAIAAISLLICLFLMCSCMRMETGIIINADGTGRVFSEVTISEAVLTQMEMTKEQFLESIKESEDSEKYEDWNKEDVERIVPGETEDETYVGIRYYKDGKLEELIGELSDSEDGSAISVDMRSESGKRIVSIRIVNDNEGSAGGEINEYISQGMMKVYFTITVPTEVLESNGIISEDKKTVTWDILSVMSGADKEITLNATFSEGSPLVLILIIIGAVVVIAIIVAVIIASINKKKRTPMPISYDPQPIPTPVTAEQNYNAQPVEPVPQPVQPEQPIAVQTVQPTEAVPEQTETKQKFCTNCGAKIEYESAFCMNCGEQIK